MTKLVVGDKVETPYGEGTYLGPWTCDGVTLAHVELDKYYEPKEDIDFVFSFDRIWLAPKVGMRAKVVAEGVTRCGETGIIREVSYMGILVEFEEENWDGSKTNGYPVWALELEREVK